MEIEVNPFGDWKRKDWLCHVVSLRWHEDQKKKD